MRKALAIALILPLFACATGSTFVDQANADLDKLSAVYQAAVAWYEANKSLFSAADQAKIAQFRADYEKAFDALRQTLSAYTNGKQTDVIALIANIVTIVFDVVTIIKAHTGTAKAFATRSAAPLTTDTKKALLLAMADNMRRAHSTSFSTDCSSCHGLK